MKKLSNAQQVVVSGGVVIPAAPIIIGGIIGTGVGNAAYTRLKKWWNTPSKQKVIIVDSHPKPPQSTPW